MTIDRAAAESIGRHLFRLDHLTGARLRIDDIEIGWQVVLEQAVEMPGVPYLVVGRDGGALGVLATVPLAEAIARYSAGEREPEPIATPATDAGPDADYEALMDRVREARHRRH